MMLRHHSKNIALSLLLILGISFLGQTTAYTDVTVDSSLEYNVKVGDFAVILFNEYTNHTVIDFTNPSQNQHEEENDTEYIRFTCTEYDTTDMMGYSTTLRFTTQTFPYNDSILLQPSYTSSFGWTDEDSESFYINNSIGTFIENSRLMIPKDINVEDFFGGNISNFVNSLMTTVNNGVTLIQEMAENFESIISQEDLGGDVIIAEDKMSGSGDWMYEMYAYNDESSNITSHITFTMDLSITINEKRMVENLMYNMDISIKTYHDSDFVREQTEQLHARSELKYDSRPFTFWNYYGIYVYIGGAVLLGGITFFFAFFYSKCKVNPNYSGVCKIYRKKLGNGSTPSETTEYVTL